MLKTASGDPSPCTRILESGAARSILYSNCCTRSDKDLNDALCPYQHLEASQFDLGPYPATSALLFWSIGRSGRER